MEKRRVAGEGEKIHEFPKVASKFRETVEWKNGEETFVGLFDDECHKLERTPLNGADYFKSSLDVKVGFFGPIK